ncbi:MAG: hypothetical protein U0166_29750 [Acidobacteriota bacterium]
MPQNQLVGMILIGVGVLDPILGFFVVAPRVPDPAKKKVVVGALLTSGALMVALGGAFLAGAFGL